MEERVKQRLRKELSRVTNLFRMMDSNRDGKISKKEFTRGLIARDHVARVIHTQEGEAVGRP